MSTRADAARLGGLARAAKYDGRDMTAAARAAYADWSSREHICRLCGTVPAPDPSLPPAERTRRGEANRRAHFLRMSQAGVSARRRRTRRARPQQPGSAAADTSSGGQDGGST